MGENRQVRHMPCPKYTSANLPFPAIVSFAVPNEMGTAMILVSGSSSVFPMEGGGLPLYSLAKHMSLPQMHICEFALPGRRIIGSSQCDGNCHGF